MAEKIWLSWEARDEFTEERVRQLAAQDPDEPGIWQGMRNRRLAAREWVAANPAPLNLGALPDGTEIVDCHGDPWVKMRGLWWSWDPDSHPDYYQPCTVSKGMSMRYHLHAIGLDDGGIEQVAAWANKSLHPHLRRVARACREAEASRDG